MHGLQAGNRGPKIQYANLEKKTRVVWVTDVGDRFQSGLLHQETYLICACAGRR